MYSISMELSLEPLASECVGDGQREKAEADGQQNYVQHGFAPALRAAARTHRHRLMSLDSCRGAHINSRRPSEASYKNSIYALRGGAQRMFCCHGRACPDHPAIGLLRHVR